MLELAKKNNFRFDSCQMPLNVMDAHFRSFGTEVVPVLVKEGIAVLGMKPIGGGVILKAGVVTAPECLRYALSLPTSVVINGCPNMELLEQAFQVASTFKPLTPSEMTALLARTREAALTGKYELFKTTSNYDGTAIHPNWMG